jgi:hypothetical protein
VQVMMKKKYGININLITLFLNQLVAQLAKGVFCISRSWVRISPPLFPSSHFHLITWPAKVANRCHVSFFRQWCNKIGRQNIFQTLGSNFAQKNVEGPELYISER